MTTKTLITLGIESSCDETGIGLYSSTKGLIAHQLFSQVELHAAYGGVVPELASRDHIRRIIPLISAVIESAGIKLTDISGIAYTQGPGLAGALLVGSCVANSLAWSLAIPVIGVNHMEGHLLAPLLEEPKPHLPFVALLVSGGHTQLIKVLGIGQYELLGESLDDAVGEAFDKTAKILGLGYPGGAALEKLATLGNPERFQFPRPMIDRPGFDFSFSGLKTFARNTAFEFPEAKADIAKAFELAAIDVLAIKSERALAHTQFSTLVVSGGVSANQALRQKLDSMASDRDAQVFYPRHEFCTDNGAMIALAGHLRLSANQGVLGGRANIQPRWSLETLTPV